MTNKDDCYLNKSEKDWKKHGNDWLKTDKCKNVKCWFIVTTR